MWTPSNARCNARAVDDRTILLAAKKNEKTTGAANDRVSPAGKTLIVDFTQTGEMDGAPGMSNGGITLRGNAV